MSHQSDHPKSDVPAIRLFVYGTLKRGQINHYPYCRDAVSIEPATVRGRLYQLPSGLLVLEVPKEDILAVGTNDALADALTQESIEVPGPGSADTRHTRSLARCSSISERTTSGMGDAEPSDPTDRQLRASARMRPVDVDDKKVSLEDKLREGFMTAYKERVGANSSAGDN